MTETYKCALCGRESDTLEAGAWTDLTMYPLCHNDERSCYEAWTRDKKRPLAKTTVGDGETTVGSRFLDDLSIETLGHGSLAVSQERTDIGTDINTLEGLIPETYHLPECQLFTGVYDDRADCICDELRACEQRMLRAAIDAMDAVDAQYESNPDWVLWEARTAIEALGVVQVDRHDFEFEDDGFDDWEKP